MSLSRPTSRAPDSGASQPLFLSLFLLLLALFILLNAISSIEPGRSNRVLDSVQRAFPSAYRAEIGDGILESDPGEVVGEVTRKRIGEIFRQVLPIARVTVEPDGNPIFVEAPVARVYAAAGGLTPVGERLAGDIAALLGAPPAGTVLELDVLFAAAASDRGAARTHRAQAVSDMVEAMSGFGIDPRLLGAGLEPGMSDSVRFVFRTAPAAGRTGGG